MLQRRPSTPSRTPCRQFSAEQGEWPSRSCKAACVASILGGCGFRSVYSLVAVLAVSRDSIPTILTACFFVCRLVCTSWLDVPVCRLGLPWVSALGDSLAGRQVRSGSFVEKIPWCCSENNQLHTSSIDVGQGLGWRLGLKQPLPLWKRSCQASQLVHIARAAERARPWIPKQMQASSSSGILHPCALSSGVRRA